MAALCDILDSKPFVVAIGGPTATGKTALSVALAKQFDGEIISADSMQVYRGLTIGTAKATLAEQQGIPHHLVDILEPEESYSVADFTTRASACIHSLTTNGKLPFVVGGTGLYVSSLLNGTRYAPEKNDPALRERLQGMDKTFLYEKLCEIDPDYAVKVHPNNKPRVVRALELYELTGRRMSEAQPAAKPAERPYHSLLLCLTCRDRSVLYERINTRVAQMVEDGVLAEAELVWRNRDAYKTAAQAIGYKEFFPYFEDESSLQVCTEKLMQNTRNYAKRQLTWFRNQENAIWLYVEEEAPFEKAAELIENRLRQKDENQSQ